MNAKIQQLYNYLKDKETRKKMGPVVTIAGFALLVASLVLFILNFVGLFVPGMEGGNFFSVFKLAGIGIFAAFVGKKWTELKIKVETSSEIEDVKLLDEPLNDQLNLNDKEEKLELKQQRDLLEARKIKGLEKLKIEKEV